MKIKLLLSSMLILSFFISTSNVQAQHHKHPHAKKQVVQNHKKQVVAHHNGDMVHAYKVLKKTHRVILAANNHVKRNKVYTGDLAKAIHHQRHAKLLLKSHKAHRAMQHSRVARMYAFKAINNNKGKVNEEWQFNEEENKTMGANVSDAELEKELKDSNPTITFKDEDISDKDMTDIEVLETAPTDYKNE